MMVEEEHRQPRISSGTTYLSDSASDKLATVERRTRCLCVNNDGKPDSNPIRELEREVDVTINTTPRVVVTCLKCGKPTGAR